MKNKRIKLSVLISILSVSCVVLAIGIIVAVQGAGSFFTSVSGNIEDYNTVSKYELKKGLSMEGNIYYIYDRVVTEYIENGKDSKEAKAYYYAVPFDDDDKYVLIIKSDTASDTSLELEKLYKAPEDSSYEYLFELGVPVEGTLINSNSDVESAFETWKTKNTDEFKDSYNIDISEFKMVPYIYDCTAPIGSKAGRFIIGCVMSLLSIAAAVVCLILYLKGTKSAVYPEQLNTGAQDMSAANDTFRPQTRVGTSQQIFPTQNGVGTSQQIYATQSGYDSSQQFYTAQTGIGTSQQIFPTQNGVGTSQQMFNQQQNMGTSQQMFNQQQNMGNPQQMFNQQQNIGTFQQMFNQQQNMGTSQQMFNQQQNIGTSQQMFNQQQNIGTSQQMFNQQQNMGNPQQMFNVQQSVINPQQTATDDDDQTVMLGYENTDDDQTVMLGYENTDDDQTVMLGYENNDDDDQTVMLGYENHDEYDDGKNMILGFDEPVEPEHPAVTNTGNIQFRQIVTDNGVRYEPIIPNNNNQN